jgi:hypothetical protein
MEHWTQTIRNLCHPFANETDFNAALDAFRNAKTGIQSYDSIDLPIVYDQHVAKINGILFLDPAAYLRSGRINLALVTANVSQSIPTADEKQFQSKLIYITPEAFEDQFDHDVIVAHTKYPALNVHFATIDAMRAAVSETFLLSIDNQIRKKNPKDVNVRGMFACLNMDTTEDVYTRYFTSMQQRQGCYYLFNMNGAIGSCKIQARTCDVNTRKCACQSDTLLGTSNPFVFMRYLVRKNVTDLKAQLNEKLTLKLTNEASINAIMADYDQLYIVYKFQVDNNNDAFSPCEMADKTTSMCACEPSLPFFNANSANNILSSRYRTAAMGNTQGFVDTLLDLSYGLRIDLLNIGINIPLFEEESVIIPTTNNNNNKNTIFLIIIIVFIVLMVSFILMFMFVSKQK